MEFGLSEDQKLLQESIRGTLEKVSPLERVRKAAEAKETHAADVWSALAELGVPGMLVPEAHGGMEMTLLDAALVAEMLGRAVAPVPFIATAVMAPIAIAGAGSKAQQEAWLPKLASGEAIAGVAIAEAASGAREGAGVTASGGKLSGKSLFALDAAKADVLVVADKAGGLHLVKGDAKGLAKVALTSIDLTRTLTELQFDNVEADALSAGDAGETFRRTVNAGRVMLAADTLGTGWAMIDKAVAYAGERKQFNRVIASFQAVKHMCAEMASELEPCRSLVWYAAHAFDAMPEEASLMAAHAKAHTAEVGRFVARTATEVHGGMGFTDLLGLHYWFKRIGLDRQLLGSPERLRHEAAAMQGWAAAD
ncbi:acyl-CoA dehydrogenase family protein [Parvibaculum sp.]|uniref:acyl-CoA dehydrogenase family protein n=1 Tax=Parvibaculum sp. TaxID=2024848 RepID=UPI001B003CE9|nr:acyl-CoA dehydrogenase family protein [Parvibaculum sp.]MBO6634239.1 acyl-CoA/acyl-ACP dehydrogenase [Parvibaculum sp.]MBO6679228.1 acyl-CoA/acyl-ACP dehydrogenase [Parvibaculum sp.]MBO6684786.1 acyl-CoA/acyl-ACP dehydrogenase [Parvibaculum sp.]MBO6904817.1 acyl-CoA/acyl-ACP dehydrogenase [Parvibaculum sp.]